MLNINKIKVIIIGLLTAISLLLILIYAQTLFTKPTFETFDSVKIPSVNIDPGSALKSEQPQSSTQVKTDFEYKIIGFIAGKEGSSVVVKKGNKEHVVVVGSKLDGKYKLISVTRDEIIFEAGSNVYKIKNLVGK
jgi:hypothetical protein